MINRNYDKLHENFPGIFYGLLLRAFFLIFVF